MQRCKLSTDATDAARVRHLFRRVCAEEKNCERDCRSRNRGGRTASAGCQVSIGTRLVRVIDSLNNVTIVNATTLKPLPTRRD